MKAYERPTAVRIGTLTDVLLASPVTLKDGESAQITSLKSFSWNS